jgi:hypothetical protein
MRLRHVLMKRLKDLPSKIARQKLIEEESLGALGHGIAERHGKRKGTGISQD